MRHTILKWSLAALMVWMPFSSSASDIFTYQGKLTNAVSSPLPDGQYRIGIRIWDVKNGGTEPLWARKYDVPVVSGNFSLMIGAEGMAWATPAPLTASLKLAVSGTSRFLEVTVMSDAGGQEKAENQWQVLAPRQELGSVPYAMNGVPIGTVVPYAGTSAPDGWVFCDGSATDGDNPQFSALFNVIGKMYGPGGGEAKSFSLPDLRGRTVIGSGQGEGLTFRDPASKLGGEMHTLSIANLPDHVHGLNLTTQSDGAHTHTFRIGQGDGGDRNMAADGDGNGGSKNESTASAGAHTHKILGDTLSDNLNNYLMKSESFSIMQPSLALN